MSEPSEREIEVFSTAQDLPPTERVAYLDRVCASDNALRQRVEELLQAGEPAGAFLANPVAGLPGPGGVSPAAVPAQKPGDRIGRYKLLQQIGEGGMGVVYMAEQEEPVRRRVALKIIKMGMDTKRVVARFEAERQALALMDHPNIAKVLDGGATETGRPYFVMELVQGVPITEFCDKNRFPAEERVKLFIPVCHAIQSAHQKGVIHRDIKPSNILITLNGGVPVPMVIDFGVAKATQQKLTEKTLFTNYGTMIGTPAYMSPEQAEMSGLDVDTRSDIYGLGVLLYELLTGTTPFPEKRLRSASHNEMQRIILEEEPERPSTRLGTLQGEQRSIAARNRGCSELALGRIFAGDLDWIVMKCLEKDRARRYDTAAGLAAELKRHLNNEPVLARPPSASYKLQKAFRRNKLAFNAVAAIVVALAVGLGLAAIGWRQTRVERDKAIAARSGEEAQRKVAEASNAAAQSQRQRAEQERQRAEHEKAEADHLLYIADMNLVERAWEQNNIGRMRQLLDDTQESPYRGFEWYYWQPQLHLASKTFRGHLGDVYAVAFSPDGRRIVTASEDKTGIVWDVATGKKLVLLKGHFAAIHSVAFSPDGRRIVTGSDDSTAKVWDASSGEELHTHNSQGDVITAVAFSPDGRRIVTANKFKMANVWDAASGAELFRFAPTDSVGSVSFSPDGRRIVTGGHGRSAKVWDAATGQELLELTHSDLVDSVKFSPDSQRIVTGSDDGIVTVWDAVGGSRLVSLQAHSASVWSVSFSPDGQRIATASGDETAKILDAASGRELLTLKEHRRSVRSVDFSPDGRWIVTGSRDGTAKVWDTANVGFSDKPGQNPNTTEGRTGLVGFIAFSPDGRRVVSGGGEPSAKVWDVASGRELATLICQSNELYSSAFSPDGERIVTGASQGFAYVWDAATGFKQRTLRHGTGGIAPVAYSPDGRRIVTGGAFDQTIKMWDAAGGLELFTFGKGTEQVRCVAFFRDGQRMVTGSGDGTAKIWDANTGQELRAFKHGENVIHSVAVSPDGQRIVTGSLDATAKIWEAATGHELMTLKGHWNTVNSVAFSPDGQRIVTSSWDRTAKVWEAASGRDLLTLAGGDAPFLFVAFSPDGQRIFTGSRNGTARVLEAARKEQVAAWQEEERAAAESLAVLRRERTVEEARELAVRAHDSIKQWLVLAPISLVPGQTGADGLDAEQIEGEGRLRPRTGEAISIGGCELKWREVTLTNELIDFNSIVGRVAGNSVAYAVCYLRSDTERHGLNMLIGSDDESKVYLNGRQVHKFAAGRICFPDQDKVRDVALNAGLNVLVFKVVNEAGGWLGSLRFTDAQGGAVKGVQVTLNPDQKEFP